MPKIFSESDREAIRQTLVESGRGLFLRYGLRKTSVEQIAKSAGIAKGTYYNFFESKEDLFLAIYDQEEEQLRVRTLSILHSHTDPKEGMKAVLDFALEFIRSDSLLARVRENGEFALLTRGVGRERLAEHLDHDTDFVAELLGALDEMGARVSIPVEEAAGVLRALTMLSFHVDEIGSEVFTRVMDRITSWIAEGFAQGGHE